MLQTDPAYDETCARLYKQLHVYVLMCMYICNHRKSENAHLYFACIAVFLCQAYVANGCTNWVVGHTTERHDVMICQSGTVCMMTRSTLHVP